MMNDESDDVAPFLGVVSPIAMTAASANTVLAPKPRSTIPREEREELLRTAAAILSEAGAEIDAGSLIVLAGWLGGMD